MKAFSALLERLYYEPTNLGKERLLLDYLQRTPDPDRGWAVSIIAGTLDLPGFKRAMVLDLIRSRVDPVLLALSHDYVGELSETVAHLWPAPPMDGPLPPLHQIVAMLQSSPKVALPAAVADLLDRMTSPERWALLKLGGGTLRIGISARFLKQVLAEFGAQPIEAIESVWHAVDPPYLDLFAWLEGRAPPPDSSAKLTFTPMMLAHPLEAAQQALITPATYAAEWKYDGIRIQLAKSAAGHALFTRTGDEIGYSFPDVLNRWDYDATIDGELVVRQAGGLDSFNALQQRLGRKAPSAKLIAAYPTEIIAYDILRHGADDLRPLPYVERRRRLAALIETERPPGVSLSPQIPFTDIADLTRLRDSAAQQPAIEGLMLKRLDSAYVAGRPTGPWFKWKIDPKLVDAVLMYAQRGSGKRSSFYSDYTFGLWQGDTLLPIGKAYFGFTDEELKQLDSWIRHHTIASFGPVREVEKALVFEVAFDSAHRSTRHKSGFALRFPRIHRIRWEKPAAEADRMESLAAMVEGEPISA